VILRTRDGNWADLKNMTTGVLEEQQSRGRVDSPVSPVVRFWKCSTLFWLVLVAFGVRLSFMLLLGTYRFDRVDDVCGIGEITNIAASIAKGHGFSSPFGYEYTGPTSWIAPVYPYFVALVFATSGS
jgi:hypothetical protein